SLPGAARCHGDVARRSAPTRTAHGGGMDSVGRRSLLRFATEPAHSAVEDRSAGAAELLGRIYAPIESRIAPFAGGFIRYDDATGARARVRHGRLAGVRTRLNRDVALELVLRHADREFSGVPAGASGSDRTTLTVGFVTQLRTRERVRAEIP